MCGIAGILLHDQSGLPIRELVKKMTGAMAHRGPDADGCFVEDNVALGHRRLSIIDLSNGANQPFADASGRFQTVFNGELFNFPALKAQLPGFPFRTSGDTEILIELFARQGIASVDAFEGFFAFAVWDRAEKCLWLVRDRMGVKPLYYYEAKGYIVFASEIRAMLATGLFTPEINQQAVNGFLHYQSVTAPDTIIKGIKEVPAGHYLKITRGQVTSGCYWDMLGTNRQYDYSNIATVKKNIEQLLQEAVSKRLVSDVPIGAFLSGGIDSSAVVALMSRASKSRPVTFNISFEEAAFDESAYAEMVAKKFNTQHHTILLKPETMLDELGNALAAMDTPSGDGVNTYVVSKAVKNAGLTVALSGVGGDELFAGYPFFKRFQQLNGAAGIWNATRPLRKLAGTMMTGSKWKDLLSINTAGIEDVYPVLRQVLAPSHIAALTHLSNEKDATAEWLRSHRQAIAAFPPLSQVSIAEFAGYTRQTLLKDTDQMSMAVSLEVREPFFDHQLVSYVLGIPDQFKYPNYPKQLLVESLGDLLPPEIVHRPKQGFTFPWRLWLKNELRQFCETHIRRICERDFIRGDKLMAKWKNFLANDQEQRWMELWLFVILEHWLEQNKL